MGIEEFDPISQPKNLKSAKKLVLEAVPTEREVKEIEEK